MGEKQGLMHHFTRRANFREPGKMPAWGIGDSFQASRGAKGALPELPMGLREIAGQQGFSFNSDVRTTDAAQKGDTVVVKAPIAAGANVNFKGTYIVAITKIRKIETD